MRRRIRPRPDYAVAVAVDRLVNKFEYPDLDTRPGVPSRGGASGMAHYFIVSRSEAQEVQDKADFVVSNVTSSLELQTAYDAIAVRSPGPVSIWHAGIFELDQDVTTPSGAWIRGLGYTDSGPPPE